MNMHRDIPGKKQMLATTRSLPLFAAALFCASCVTTYHAPDVEVAAQYGSAVDASFEGAQTTLIGSALQFPRRNADADPWWQDFETAGLNGFIDDVLMRNRDLRTAALRVQRARLQVGQARNERLPVASGSVSDSTREAIRGGAPDQDSASAQLSLSYEVDLWRRLETAETAADWGARASAEDLDSTILLLIANACDLYWRLADINARIARGEEAVDTARRTTALIDVQFAAGAVSRLEIFEASQSFQQRVGNQARLQQQRSELRSAIAVLRGGPYWPEAEEPQAMSASALSIDAGVPVDLLGRRPDLRAAEWRLRQTLADADRVRLSAYPQLSLNLGASGSGNSVGDLLDRPVRTLTRSLLLPFLDFNGTRLRIAVAQKDYEIAAEAFAQRLIEAIGDVETANAARAPLEAQVISARNTLEAAEQAEHLYALRYRAGAAPLRLWLDAQQSRLSAEDALSQAALAQRRNEIMLVKALGGSPRTRRSIDTSISLSGAQ
jgi:NodT family efflux transporter outer membrane factor (OMF) lipoprotein